MNCKEKKPDKISKSAVSRVVISAGEKKKKKRVIDQMVEQLMPNNRK